MKWINAFGLLLQFVSFWFAAPELLGVNTLKRFEAGLRKFVSSLPLILMMVVVLGFAISLSVMGILKGVEGGEGGLTKPEMIQFIIVLIVCMIFYAVFMFFFKRIKTWLDLHLAQPLITGLINNNKARSSALIVGAALFTLGFLLQLFVVIIS